MEMEITRSPSPISPVGSSFSQKDSDLLKKDFFTNINNPLHTDSDQEEPESVQIHVQKNAPLSLNERLTPPVSDLTPIYENGLYSVRGSSPSHSSPTFATSISSPVLSSNVLGLVSQKDSDLLKKDFFTNVNNPLHTDSDQEEPESVQIHVQKNFPPLRTITSSSSTSSSSTSIGSTSTQSYRPRSLFHMFGRSRDKVSPSQPSNSSSALNSSNSLSSVPANHRSSSPVSAASSDLSEKDFLTNGTGNDPKSEHVQIHGAVPTLTSSSSASSSSSALSSSNSLSRHSVRPLLPPNNILLPNQVADFGHSDSASIIANLSPPASPTSSKGTSSHLEKMQIDNSQALSEMTQMTEAALAAARQVDAEIAELLQQRSNARMVEAVLPTMFQMQPSSSSLVSSSSSSSLSNSHALPKPISSTGNTLPKHAPAAEGSRSPAVQQPSKTSSNGITSKQPQVKQLPKKQLTHREFNGLPSSSIGSTNRKPLVSKKNPLYRNYLRKSERTLPPLNECPPKAETSDTPSSIPRYMRPTVASQERDKDRSPSSTSIGSLNGAKSVGSRGIVSRTSNGHTPPSSNKRPHKAKTPDTSSSIPRHMQSTVASQNKDIATQKQKPPKLKVGTGMRSLRRPAPVKTPVQSLNNTDGFSLRIAPGSPLTPGADREPASPTS